MSQKPISFSSFDDLEEIQNNQKPEILEKVNTLWVKRPTAKILANQGIKKSAKFANPEWSEAVQTYIKTLCEIKDEITTDDIRFYWEKNPGLPQTHSWSALGHEMKEAQSRGLIKVTSRTMRSKIPQSHGHHIYVWEVIKSVR